MNINSSLTPVSLNRLSDSKPTPAPNNSKASFQQTVSNTNTSASKPSTSSSTLSNKTPVTGQNIATINVTDKNLRQNTAANITDQQNATLAEAQDVVVQLQQQPQQINRSLEFKVEESSGRTVITVIDRSTGETVKQIPSEEIIQLGIRLKELADSLHESNNKENVSGLLLKRQV